VGEVVPHRGGPDRLRHGDLDIPDQERDGGAHRRQAGPLWTFFYNKWFFDELYDLVFVRGAARLGDLFWKRVDQATIDKFGPDGIARASLFGGRRLVRMQTGFLYHYAFVMLLGVAGLLSYALFAFGGAG
jgi:NADH-quinone oxidoreductase subunit L